MLRIQVVPRGDENIYRILRQKIDTEARTFKWSDKRKLSLKHSQKGYPGRIRLGDAEGILVGETEGERLLGAFVGRLAAWFPQEVAAINIQLLAEDAVRKSAKGK